MTEISSIKPDLQFGPRLFVSYSHEDRGFVNRLALDLKSRNVDLWMDMYEIKGGESILQSIEDAIKHTDIFLVVLSAHSLNSKWVHNELLMISQLVITQEKILIPIVADKCDVPLFLATRKWIDFAHQYELALNELLSSLEHWGLWKKDKVLGAMLEDLEKKESSEKGLSNGYTAIGRIAFQIGLYGEAKEILEKGMRLDPTNSDPVHLRAIVLIKCGQFTEAEAILRNLSSEGPQKERAFFNLACLYSRWAQVAGDQDRRIRERCLKQCYENLTKAFRFKIVEWLKTYGHRRDPMGDILGDPDLAYGIRAYPKIEKYLKIKARQYRHRWSARQVCGGGGGCLVGQAKVLLKGGKEIPIEDIRCGQEVVSNTIGNNSQVSMIWRKMRSLADQGVCINNKLTTTNGQRILTTKGWQEADQLHVGDMMLGPGRRTERIRKIERWIGARAVFQLGLEGRPFFTADQVLVHNLKD
ncbi:MAG: TIR domain-containing protein [Candidatus Bathyarchaeia archaeon]